MQKHVDSVLIRENTGQQKPVFWHIICSVTSDIFDRCKHQNGISSVKGNILMQKDKGAID